MNWNDVDRLLSECANRTGSDDDPELRALRTAILIEDTFQIVLTDEQIDTSILEDPAALRELLAQIPHHA